MINSFMQYKGYIGSVEISEEDTCLFGKVQGINALVSYEGKTAKALVKDFHTAVDDYLLTCEETGQNPEISYKGSFNVRIKPELHRRLALYAMQHQETLNRSTEKAIEALVASA